MQRLQLAQGQWIWQHSFLSHPGPGSFNPSADWNPVSDWSKSLSWYEQGKCAEREVLGRSVSLNGFSFFSQIENSPHEFALYVIHASGGKPAHCCLITSSLPILCVWVECVPWSNRTRSRPLSLFVHCVCGVVFCLLRDPSEMSPLERKSWIIVLWALSAVSFGLHMLNSKYSLFSGKGLLP